MKKTYETSEIQYTDEGALKITLNRPSVLNALSDALGRELQYVLH